MEKYKSINTPVGLLSVCNNDSFSYDVERHQQYAEQTIIDNEIIPRIVNAKTILDIGSHVGYHSLAYAKMNDYVKIIAFEPQNEIFQILEKNIEQNNLQNKITAVNKCVGHTCMHTNLSNVVDDGPNANTQIEYNSKNYYNFGGLSIGTSGQITEMVTIDSMDIEKVDYMKIDVEGAEFLVLIGAKKTILRDKPIICFEDLKYLPKEYLNKLGFDEKITSYDILKSYGYTNFKQIEYQNVLAWID